MRIAKVKTVTSPIDVLVPITSEDKPDISEEIQNKWQKIVDLAAKIIGVPSGLITRLSETQLEVFLTSRTANNIFEPNLKLDLGAGWYCENVVGTRNGLTVQNALGMEEWRDNNPSIPFKMISYLGIPILWPDGEVFGTFCMLDNKENKYSEIYKELLASLRDIIQNDLNAMLLYQKVQSDLVRKEVQIKEIHHRIKNHFHLLISTLGMQSFFNSYQNSESIILDIQSRILAVSAIHERLSNSINLDEILLCDYLSELGKDIINTLADKEISFNCICNDIITDNNIYMPCGLLLNELMTNSLKYAFEKTGNPAITLILEKSGQEIVFIYKDNGVGLLEKSEIQKSNSLGMLLIQQTVLQLGGCCQILDEDGFVFKMTFKF